MVFTSFVICVKRLLQFGSILAPKEYTGKYYQ